MRNAYHIERFLPKSVFNKNYPENPKTFGEHLRKAGIDAGLLMKDLAKQIGVNENSVTNEDARGRIPKGENMEVMPPADPPVADIEKNIFWLREVVEFLKACFSRLFSLSLVRECGAVFCSIECPK